MAMNSFRIVESFQIFKNQLVCLLIITDFKAIEPFTFDNRMKGFNACIIPRKSFLRITALHIFGCFFIFLCNILAATIRIEQLGLGHLNILYIALKLVEFEVSRNHEVLNIMIVEEPEAHIHTHIQRTLFENLNIKENYTQVIMTTHSTHLSEVSNIAKMNVLMRRGNQAIVMRPTNGLQEFAEESFGISDLSIERCIERYLDAI